MTFKIVHEADGTLHVYLPRATGDVKLASFYSAALDEGVPAPEALGFIFRSPTDPRVKQEVIRRWTGGEGATSMAASLGISKTTIYGIVNEAKLPLHGKMPVQTRAATPAPPWGAAPTAEVAPPAPVPEPIKQEPAPIAPVAKFQLGRRSAMGTR